MGEEIERNLRFACDQGHSYGKVLDIRYMEEAHEECNLFNEASFQGKTRMTIDVINHLLTSAIILNTYREEEIFPIIIQNSWSMILRSG